MSNDEQLNDASCLSLSLADEGGGDVEGSYSLTHSCVLSMLYVCADWFVLNDYFCRSLARSLTLLTTTTSPLILYYISLLYYFKTAVCFVQK